MADPLAPRGLLGKVLAVAVCLVAAAAGSGARAATAEIRIESGPAPVELLLPRPGSTLPGGGVAVLAWEPREGLDLTALGLHEWEAFLSLDGGERYAVRLTPHLDLGLRRFTFEVPPVAAADVRLMLRFGDEVTERGYEVPGRFAIAPPAAAPAAAGLPGVGPGEAARPGEPGVVQWVEGSRRGRDLRRRTALPPPAAAVPLRWTAAGSRPACLAPRPAGSAPAAGAARRGEPADPCVRLAAGASRLPPLDLLLATGRRNE